MSTAPSPSSSFSTPYLASPHFPMALSPHLSRANMRRIFHGARAFFASSRAKKVNESSILLTSHHLISLERKYTNLTFWKEHTFPSKSYESSLGNMSYRPWVYSHRRVPAECINNTCCLRWKLCPLRLWRSFFLLSSILNPTRVRFLPFCTQDN